MIDYINANLIGAASTTRDINVFDSFRKDDANRKRILVGQLNQHRSFKAAENHRDWFHQHVGKKKEYKCGICLITEPYIVNNRLKLFDGLEIFQYNGNERIRACIAISKGIQAWPVLQFTDRDQTVIGFKNNHKTILVSSTYMAHPDPDSQDEPPPHPPDIFKRLVEYCTINNFDLIVGSDVNSHSSLWNSTNDNERGDALAEYILACNIHVLNEGCKPTFENAVRKEILDISMANSHALDLIDNWKVEDRHTQSDHKLISFTIDTNIKIDLGFRRNIRKTDWRE